MKLCYIDESGDGCDLMPGKPRVQPVFTLAAIVFDESLLREVTYEYLALKHERKPSAVSGPEPDRILDRVLHEIKGSALRRQIRDESHKERRRALNFLAETVRLLERFDTRVFGRVYVKPLGETFREASVYGAAVQSTCRTFQRYLELVDDMGVVIADDRTKQLNRSAAHSVFTQKFRRGGDAFGRICEVPTFAQGQNHVGLHIVDLVASAILTPLALSVYCEPFIPDNAHLSSGYLDIRRLLAGRLRNLEYRYEDDEKMRGGVTVSDRLGERSSCHLFEWPPAAPPPTVGSTRA